MMEVGRDFERMRDYLVGRMSDEERRTFDDRLARDPELVREFEQTLRLQEGLQVLKARGYFEQRVARAPSSARVGGLSWGRRLLVPALAAAAVAGLALLLWVQPRPAAPGVLRASLESGVPSVTAHFTFVSMRASSSPDLALPSQGLIELRVQPTAHATVSHFRVTLMREEQGVSAASLGTLDSLALGNDGYVHLYVDASRLTSGAYRLQVGPQSGPSAAGETFTFRLRAGAGNPAP